MYKPVIRSPFLGLSRPHNAQKSQHLLSPYVDGLLKRQSGEGRSSTRSAEGQVLQEGAVAAIWTEGDCTAVAGIPFFPFDLTLRHVAGVSQFSLIIHLSLIESRRYGNPLC